MHASLISAEVGDDAFREELEAFVGWVVGAPDDEGAAAGVDVALDLLRNLVGHADEVGVTPGLG